MKGIALVTVMGFILVLSMLMVPLAFGITELTSSTNVTSRQVDVQEAERDAVELVRFNIAVNAFPVSGLQCPGVVRQPFIITPTATLMQGILTTATLSCASVVTGLGSSAVYRYWDFSIMYTGSGNNIAFTGSAVQYIESDKVYITHIMMANK